jgi:dUTP pyrophosphatase
MSTYGDDVTQALGEFTPRVLHVRRLSDTATLPSKPRAGDVGYDLHADVPEELTLEFGARLRVPTGISVAIPDGCYGRVAPRSGLAATYGIDVLAGVIDPSYRGELLIILLNTGGKEVTISPGMRIAQLIIERCETPEVVEVDELPETGRGAGGFGSTGH